MSTNPCGALLLVLASALTAQAPPPAVQAPRPIDFAALDRTMPKTPKLTAEALYGLFLFGKNGEKRVFAILDRSQDAGDKRFDVLYLDRDADGDLAEDGETIRAGAKGSVFAIGDFLDPGTGATHKDFTPACSEASFRCAILPLGRNVTIGGYGPERETY